MDTQAIIEYMKGWGYRTLPKHHPDSPGYAGLVVAVRERPTLQHYDPHRIHLRVRDADGEADWRTMSWLTPSAYSTHVCPGRIVLHDRHGKATEFFAFGGRLQVISQETESIYELRSGAPILALTPDEESLPDQLASEVEELMAEAKAGWHGDDEGFDRRLGDVEPVVLYSAAVHSLLTRFQESEAMMTAYADLAELLEHERAWLIRQGLWPAAPLSVADLLSPDREDSSTDGSG
jgi:hypothetical protein